MSMQLGSVISRYHYSAYWQTWSRVLHDPRPHDAYPWWIEVNLTPIPGSPDSNWENSVLPIIVRKHVTTPGKGDKLVNELPMLILADMGRVLPFVTKDFLLYRDILPMIDVHRLRNLGSPGQPLHRLVMPLFNHKIPEPSRRP